MNINVACCDDNTRKNPIRKVKGILSGVQNDFNI